MITNLKTRLSAILRFRALIVLRAESLRIPINIHAARSAAACSESVTSATAAIRLLMSTIGVSEMNRMLSRVVVTLHTLRDGFKENVYGCAVAVPPCWRYHLIRQTRRTVW
jgi:hypothetical protein